MRVVNGFLKWLVLMVLSLASGLAVIILLSSNAELDIFWLRIIMLFAISFIGGFFCRMLFHRLPGVVLFLIALVSETLAILLIDYFYDSPYRLAFLTSNFTLQNPAASDIAQGVLILFITLPTLFFLRRRKKTPKIEKTPKKRQAAKQTPKPEFTLEQKIRPVLVSLNPANWQMTQDASRKIKKLFSKTKKTTRSKTVQVSKPKVPSSKKATSTSRKTSTGKTKKTTRKKPASAKLTLPRKLTHSQQNDVKLMGEEEHVCPYCLEEVHKNDSRGVVVCKECGTWHHKDCWELTGTCGVAHRNEL